MKTRITQTLLALLFALLFPMTMSAYDFEVDGLYYKLTSVHSVGVTYHDANFNSYSGDITIPSSIEVDGESYTVSSIEPNAFRGSTGLTSVTIPQSVGSIKSSGFRDCTSLTSVSIPNRTFTLGNRAFMGCTALETIHLTIHITSLPDSLFYGCTGLKTMNLFNNYQIETVGNEVFSGCTSLSSIWMPGKVQSYGRGFLRGCTSLENITLRGSVKEIPPAMFSGCTSLTNVVIPDSITAIGDSVFSYCEALTNIDLPDSLETVGNYAFYYCTGITQLDLPASVRTIRRGAFCNTGLTSFVIPEGVTEIEYSTFMDCYNLKDIVFPSTLKTIGPQAFLSTGFEEIVIPNTVTKLSWAAFNYCHNLKHVQLSDSLTVLEQNVFCYTGLIEMDIPQSVKRIDFGAFQRSAIKRVFIPKSVETIAGGAFTECGGLEDIIVEEGNPNYDSRDNCNALIETATNILLKGGKKTVIPNTVTSIANGAFNWSGIAQITFPESVISVGSAFVRCTNLQEVNISKSVTSIATRAFENCYNLTTINIDSDNPVYDSRDSCNAIIETATNTVFQGCPGTKIPEGITTIAPYAFYGMASGDQYFTYGISSITLPASLTYIGHEAFGNGNRLLTVISKAAVPPTLENENVFNTNCYYDATLHVLASSLEAYQAAEGWKNFRMILPLGDNGEPMEQTGAPYRDGWTYSPNYDYVAIGLKNRPTEPDATIYYHIAKSPYTVQPIDSTEWTEYTEPVKFTEIGYYTFEYYAISPGKLMSTVTRSSVYIDTFDPYDYLADFDFRVDGLHYKILSDSTAGLCERYRDLEDYGLWSCYYGDIVIPETVTFEDVTYTVTAIMNNTFWQSQLTSISVPNTLTHIGDSAFYEAELPQQFTLPESVTHIGKEAFVWSSLTSVNIPASVEYIGTAAFGTLDTLAVDKHNRFYDSRGNCNAIIETATNKLIIGCENSSIPTSVEAIGDSAFLYIEYFNLDNHVVLPNAVRTIGKMAFGGYGVNILEIGKGVEFIDTCAFYNCWDLWEITCHSIYPPDAYNAFESEDLPWQTTNVYEYAVLRVPAQSLNAYRNHQEWGRFTQIETFDYEGNYDINGDGKVTISDVTDLINLLLKGEEPYYADVNGDGYVKISDVTELINRLLSGDGD